MIYVVAVPGFAKIGFADDVRRRLTEYRQHNPTVVGFAGVYDGSIRSESCLQARARERWPRLRETEWLIGATGPEVVALVEEHLAEAQMFEAMDPPKTAPTVESDSSKEIAAVMAENAPGADAIKRAFNRSLILKWANGTRIPDPASMVRIEEFTNGRVRADSWGDSPVAGRSKATRALLATRLSKSEIARRMGLSQGYISQVMAGVSKAGWPTRRAAFDVFGIPVTDWDEIDDSADTVEGEDVCEGPALLRAEIDRAGITDDMVAEELKVDPSALSRYLSRKSKPKHRTRNRISEWSEGRVPIESWDAKYAAAEPEAAQ